MDDPALAVVLWVFSLEFIDIYMLFVYCVASFLFKNVQKIILKR